MIDLPKKIQIILSNKDILCHIRGDIAVTLYALDHNWGDDCSITIGFHVEVLRVKLITGKLTLILLLVQPAY